MKKYGLLILLATLLVSCKSENKGIVKSESEHAELPTIIEGRVLNREVYPHTNKVELIVENFRGQQDEFVADITETGEFRFKFYPKTRREIKLRPIEDVLIVAPGDSLYIVKDFSNISSSDISGKGAQLNQCISIFRNQYLGRYSYPYDKPYLEFKEICQKEKTESVEMAKQFQKQHQAPDDFAYWVEKQIEMDFSKALFQYPLQYYLRTKAPFEEHEVYYDFIKDLESCFENGMVVSDYFNVSQQLLNLKAKPYVAKDGGMVDIYSFGKELIHELMSSGENNYLNQFLVYTFINEDLSANSLYLVDENKEFLDKHLTDPFLRSTFEEQYLRVKDYRENPKKRSDAILNGDYGDLGQRGEAVSVHRHNIIKNIIEEHPQKVLYIDVWATWCKPCIDNMFYSKILMNHFEGQDIEFVYVCFNEQKEAQPIIQKYGIERGRHYFMNTEETDAFLKRFRLLSNCGIPYYLLVNKDGIIVDYGTYLSPKSAITKHKIEQLLHTP